MAAETPRETLHHALLALLAQHDGQAAIEEESALRAAVTAALGLDVEQRPAPAPEPEVPAVPQIIMDCDPGGDDVVALFWLLALGQKKLCNVRAVTTTEGNVKAPLTFAAADKVLTLLSSAVSDVDVCAQTPSAARHGDRPRRGLGIHFVPSSARFRDGAGNTLAHRTARARREAEGGGPDGGAAGLGLDNSLGMGKTPRTGPGTGGEWGKTRAR